MYLYLLTTITSIRFDEFFPNRYCWLYRFSLYSLCDAYFSFFLCTFLGDFFVKFLIDTELKSSLNICLYLAVYCLFNYSNSSSKHLFYPSFFFIFLFVLYSVHQSLALFYLDIFIINYINLTQSFCFVFFCKVCTASVILALLFSPYYSLWILVMNEWFFFCWIR